MTVIAITLTTTLWLRLRNQWLFLFWMFINSPILYFFIGQKIDHTVTPRRLRDVSYMTSVTLNEVFADRGYSLKSEMVILFWPYNTKCTIVYSVVYSTTYSNIYSRKYRTVHSIMYSTIYIFF